MPLKRSVSFYSSLVYLFISILIYMKQFMHFSFQKSIIKRDNQWIFVCLADAGYVVCLIEPLHSGGLCAAAGSRRLSAAHDTTPAAGHNFHNVVLLFAASDIFHNGMGIGQSADDADMQRRAFIGNGKFFDTVLASGTCFRNAVHGRGGPQSGAA